MLLIYERIETEPRHLATHPKKAILPQGDNHEVVSRFHGCVVRLRRFGVGAVRALQALAHQRCVDVWRRGESGQSASGAAILRAAIADRAALRDDPARGDGSAGAARLSPATGLRPGDPPGTEMDQRARGSESTTPFERAIHAESGKRAGTATSNQTVERAKAEESTRTQERAKGSESTKASKRAKFRRTTERSL
jgi:hypothetical protein